MSRKSKKRKARKAIHDHATGLWPLATSIRQATAPDFVDFNRVAARHEALQYRIAPDCKVVIQFTGMATQDAIRKLIKYLEMGLDDFPVDSDRSAPVQL
jgi:hypothetical protein